MQRGEVWWVEFDPAVGSEIRKNQIMAADKSRLKDRLGTLSKIDMLAVEDAMKLHLGLPR